MLLTVALDTGMVYVASLRRSDDQEVLLRNGDVIPTQIEFRNTISSATTVDMGGSTGLRLSIKPKGEYDANPLLSFSSWTRTVTGQSIDYRSLLNTASGGIDRLLGVDPYDSFETVAIQAIANTKLGSYFDLSDSAGVVRVWMGPQSQTTGPDAPENGRLLKVTLDGAENADGTAQKIASALDADIEFVATASANVVTATATVFGRRIAPHCRSSGYGITVLVAGGDETVQDSASVTLQAEIAWTYDGNLTTTRAFKWKVENTNRRASQPVSLPFFDTSNIASSVLLFIQQSLTEPQKAQARANIGAGQSILGTPQNGNIVGVLNNSLTYTTLSALGAGVDGGQV